MKQISFAFQQEASLVTFNLLSYKLPTVLSPLIKKDTKKVSLKILLKQV